MAFHLYEDTWETSTTTGTGTYTLGGAVAGWRAFSAQYANADTCLYAAFDGVGFEMGIGTYSGGTLARTTVYRSTNANAAINWGVGTRNVMVTPLGISMEQILTPGSLGYPRRTADNAWSYDLAGHIKGVIDGSAATAGEVGEAIVVTSGAVTLASGSVVNIIGTALQAGDWDIDGSVIFGNPGTSVYSYVQAGWSLTNGAMANNQQIQINFQAGDSIALRTLTGQLNVSSSTNIFLTAGAAWTTGAPTATGSFYFRRRR
jgi:hypothetical protein